MTITHSAAARASLAAQVASLVAAGAGTAKVRCKDATVTIVDFDMSATPFGAPSGGVITANGLPLAGTAVADGDVDNFEVLDKDANVIFAGSITATGGGGDMTFNNITITNGQDCSLTGANYTVAA